MRATATLATALLLLCAACCARPAVRLPPGFEAPAGAAYSSTTLYHSLAHHLRTLPLGANPRSLAALPPTNAAPRLGEAGRRQATLVVVPEAFAPEDAQGELADNAFPLDAMSRTLVTGVVEAGASQELLGAFAPGHVRVLELPELMDDEAVAAALRACNVELGSIQEGASFVLEGARFDEHDAPALLGAAVTLCARRGGDEQVVVADMRRALGLVASKYGAQSAQAASAARMVERVVAAQPAAFVLATDAAFFSAQERPATTEAAPLKLTPVGTLESDPSTGTTQIIIWFVILAVAAILAVAILTCGVGLDIRKDTLLYQTTCLRGQPQL